MNSILTLHKLEDKKKKILEKIMIIKDMLNK